nr:putative reverse transcriptase domain-containing protein [Tanacetum cinerariifolium]
MENPNHPNDPNVPEGEQAPAAPDGFAPQWIDPEVNEEVMDDDDWDDEVEWLMAPVTPPRATMTTGQIMSRLKEIETRVQQVESRVDTHSSGQMAVQGHDVIAGSSQQERPYQQERPAGKTSRNDQQVLPAVTALPAGTALPVGTTTLPEKLSPRYVGPFEVQEKVGSIAYKLELPHVSNLKKCYSDEPLAFAFEGLHVNDKIRFVEEPIEIMDLEVKRLTKSRVPICQGSMELKKRS